MKQKSPTRSGTWITVFVFGVLFISAGIGYLVVQLLMGEVTGGSIAAAVSCVSGGLAGAILAVSMLRASRSTP